ncbi:TIGR00725 family protein [Desulfonema limicola]|uniref:AMP nucleosidase n=1 Tax=Desulfonema limicola TaxID=45656 RepID=A0A975GG35_9BACT|nr:TIGR00730 family Rossman fold protein [Desulfonema limicola]QTA79872.1 TIGR00725 family protein [Desulfonema limicola]
MNKDKPFTSVSRPKILHFHESNGPVDEAIYGLMEKAGGIRQHKYIREMIIAALKAGQEDEDQADLRLMNTTLKEMRFTAKIFGPYREVKKVTVFGSARIMPDVAAYQAAVLLGKKLQEAGYMVITGGGPGIMQAVNEGAGARYSFGINIQLPFEQKTNHIVDGNPKSITYKYFFNRKVAFIKEAHAVVLFPGGFGTLDEAMEVLTLVQTGKRNLIPLILIDPPGSSYWKTWIDFLQQELMVQGYINPPDFNLFHLADNAQQAVDLINQFYKRFHSLVYAGKKLVIRMNSKISENKILKLNASFSDILVHGGKIISSGPLPEELDESGMDHLPRIIVDFDRLNFGRLRKMIDVINSDEFDTQ